MEYNKDSLFYTCIKCKSKKTFEKALRLYAENGYELDDHYEDMEIPFPLFVIQFGHKTILYRDPLQRKVIKLPRKKPLAFPRIMMVSDDEKSWKPRMVYCKMPKPLQRQFVANKYSPGANTENQTTLLRTWKFAKEYLNSDELMTEGTKAIW